MLTGTPPAEAVVGRAWRPKPARRQVHRWRRQHHLPASGMADGQHRVAERGNRDGRVVRNVAALLAGRFRPDYRSPRTAQVVARARQSRCGRLCSPASRPGFPIAASGASSRPCCTGPRRAARRSAPPYVRTSRRAIATHGQPRAMWLASAITRSAAGARRWKPPYAGLSQPEETEPFRSAPYRTTFGRPCPVMACGPGVRAGRWCYHHHHGIGTPPPSSAKPAARK